MLLLSLPPLLLGLLFAQPWFVTTGTALSDLSLSAPDEFCEAAPAPVSAESELKAAGLRGCLRGWLYGWCRANCTLF
jgi:hypothetical protein